MTEYASPFADDDEAYLPPGGTVAPVKLNGAAGPWESRFGMQKWEEIGATSVAVYTWVVEGIIPERESVLGFGQSGSGKTFGLSDMGLCIARGITFNGFNVQRGLVVYCAVEAGKGFAKRKVAYARHHEIGPDEHIPFVLLTKKVNLFASDEGTLQLIEEILHIKAMYEEELRLVIIDTLSAATPGMNENVSHDVTPVRARVDMICQKVGASVLVVHHMSKGGTTPRGHSSLTADYETTIEFETLAERNDGLPVHKATVEKQREGLKGVSWCFALKQVQVGVNMWGNPETSCVPIPIGKNEPREKSERTGFTIYSEKAKMVFGCLMKALAEHGVDAPPELQLPIGSRVVRGRHWQEAYQAVDPYEGTDDTPERSEFRAKDTIKYHGTKLLNLHLINRIKPWVWWTGKHVSGFPETRPRTQAHAPVAVAGTEDVSEF